MSRWLINISGARAEILDLCPTERVRFVSLGWAMLMASGLAAVSLWAALTGIIGINGIIAVPAAIGCGLIVLGVDRWRVTSAPARGLPPWTQLLPKLAVTLLVAVIVAVPLVLRVFQAEINQEIAVLKEQQVAAFLQATQESVIGKQVSILRARVDRINAIIQRGPSKPGYSQALGALPAAKRELQAAENRQSLVNNRFIEANGANTGLVLRLQALSHAEAGDATLSASVFLLVALFFVIEALPLAVQLLQRPGNYERIFLEAQRQELLYARRSVLRAPSASQLPRLGYSSLAGADLSSIWNPAAQRRDIDGIADTRDFDLSSIWSSAADRRDIGGVLDRRDATEPELDPAESYEHTRYEDAALATLEDSRVNDWPTDPEGIQLRWDSDDV